MSPIEDRSVICPSCHDKFDLPDRLQSPFCLVRPRKTFDPFEQFERVWAALAQCPGCGFCMVVYVKDWGKQDDKISGHYRVTRWYPPTVPKIDPNLPTPYQNDMKEARACLTVNAPNACVAMCRRVISRLAIDRGADASWTTGRQLNHLKENSLIEEKLLKAANAVKAFGDQGAHPPKEVSLEEARQSYSITESILDYALLLDQKLGLAATDKEEKDTR